MVLHRLTGYLGVRVTLGQLLQLFTTHAPEHTITQRVEEILRDEEVTLERFLSDDQYEDHRAELEWDLADSQLDDLAIGKLTHDVVDRESGAAFVLGYEIFTMDLEEVPPLFSYTSHVSGQGLEGLKTQLRKELEGLAVQDFEIQAVQVQDDCACCT